jgi:hypothetical protein
MSAGDNGTCRVYPSGSSWWLDLIGYNEAALKDVGKLYRLTVNPVWKNNAEIGDLFFSPDIGSGQSRNIGQHKYCALSQTRFDYNNYRACVLVRNSNGTWTLSAPKVGNGHELRCRLFLTTDLASN